MSNQISYAVTDGVARIELNRPEVSNSVDLATAQTFAAAIDKAADDDTVGAILLTGAGKRFCAGGDVASMITAVDQAAYLVELAHALDHATQKLAAIEKPVVAHVQGAVAGAGLAVMLSCDLIVADPGTKFVIAYPGVGLVPDCGVSWLLPRAIGQQRALHFALTNTPIDSEQALDWGMVTEVGDAERAVELATGLAAGPTYALGQARRLLRNSWESDRAAVGLDEATTIGRAVVTDEAQALLANFGNR